MLVADTNIPSMLRAAEKQLIISLEKSRATFEHSGLRGDGAEIPLREAFDTHLPQYLTAGTGEVIDSRGNRSGQTDVVIANADQPFRSPRDEASVYLIEGLAAAAEAKARLTTRELADIIKKSMKFKRLRVHDNEGDFVFCAEADKNRFYRCPPYFGFAFESVVSTRTLLKTLNSVPDIVTDDAIDTPLPGLDALFILQKGFAVNIRVGESFGLMDRSTGWIWRDSDKVLVDMFLWLSAVMPRVQRFRSITIPYLADIMAESQ